MSFGSPSWRPLQWRGKTGCAFQSTGYTPSVRFAGSEVPSNPTAFNRGMIAPGNHNFERFAALCNTPEVEPRRLRRSGRLRASPTVGVCKTGGHTIQRRTLPQPRFARQLPQRGSQGCFAPGNDGSQGGFAARVAKMATPATLSINCLLVQSSRVIEDCNFRRNCYTIRQHLIHCVPCAAKDTQEGNLHECHWKNRKESRKQIPELL